jgi:hypothetical protein
MKAHPKLLGRPPLPHKHGGPPAFATYPAEWLIQLISC